MSKVSYAICSEEHSYKIIAILEEFVCDCKHNLFSLDAVKTEAESVQKRIEKIRDSYEKI